MHPHPTTVEEAIKAHRIAIETDEASFDDNFTPIDEALAEATGDAEVEAYKAFVQAPCLSHVDVNTKIGYLLNGSVGKRTPLVDCLYEYSDGDTDVIRQFLHSLLVEAR